MVYSRFYGAFYVILGLVSIYSRVNMHLMLLWDTIIWVTPNRGLYSWYVAYFVQKQNCKLGQDIQKER